MLLAPMQQMPHDKEPYVYDKNDPKRAHIMPILALSSACR